MHYHPLLCLIFKPFAQVLPLAKLYNFLPFNEETKQFTTGKATFQLFFSQYFRVPCYLLLLHTTTVYSEML